ncbi:VOC family protein [Streptomyces sp. NPDC049577]|uniref:VOC family protein n=1 Tax=Streptomyces sp. NPDC049577 TaxID=3155153 RepID=UPI00341E9DF8
MATQLNHLIVHCRDRHETARFVSDLLGTEPPVDFDIFAQITSANGVGVDFADSIVDADRINPSHLAFLVTDEEFDAALGRITERGVPHWAEPGKKVKGINHLYGGRGVYVEDPGGTLILELITAPYGEVPEYVTA